MGDEDKDGRTPDSIKKTLQHWLKKERRAWIKSFAAKPGSSGRAWREHVKAMKRDPIGVALIKVGVDWAWLFEEYAHADAADKAWRAPPAEPSPNQPDLFGAVDGRPMPEFGTRPAKEHGEYIDSEAVKKEEHETFEKFDPQKAKPVDMDKDATIKERKAIEAAAAANERRKLANELMRRADGDTEVTNEDLIDGKWKKPKAAE